MKNADIDKGIKRRKTSQKPPEDSTRQYAQVMNKFVKTQTPIGNGIELVSATPFSGERGVNDI